MTLSPSHEFKTSVPLIQTLRIDPDRASRFSWPVTVAEPGTGIIRAKAIGQTAGDAIEQKLPIRALGIPAFSARSGLITADDERVELPVGLSGDASPSTAKYQLSLAGSTIGPVLGNFNQLIDYPYGCTEQTMSRLVPSIVALQLHNKLGLPLSTADLHKFDRVYQMSMDKLTSYHHDDGGWGWWQSDSSNPYLTCIVVEGMKMVRDLHHFKLDDAMMLSGVHWLKTAVVELKKQLSDPKLTDTYLVHEYNTDMARALYTIGLFEKPPADVQKWLVARYLQLPPEGLAYLVLALHRQGNDTSANLAYRRLLSLANERTDTTDWEHTTAMCKRMHLMGVSDWTYSFTGVETTALCASRGAGYGT